MAEGHGIVLMASALVKLEMRFRQNGCQIDARWSGQAVAKMLCSVE
jgi:hypothetical protein